jgi:hypothetical protein
MKGALGWMAGGRLDVDDVHAISPAEWQAWHDRWDVLLADVNLDDGPGQPVSRGPGGRTPLAVAERPSSRIGRARRA